MNPRLVLETGHVFDARGRVTHTREPNASHGPRFQLVRSADDVAWAIRDDVADPLADELASLARTEPPTADRRAPPVHAARYIQLLDITEPSSGPELAFPDELPPEFSDDAIVTLVDEHNLDRHFRGWTTGEIAERSPALAILDGDVPVSLCFCARLSPIAASAGLDTAAPYRGRNYGPRVTAAWAHAIRATGRTPLYATSWTNTASLAVARKLGLVAFASYWSSG